MTVRSRCVEISTCGTPGCCCSILLSHSLAASSVFSSEALTPSPPAQLLSGAAVFSRFQLGLCMKLTNPLSSGGGEHSRKQHNRFLFCPAAEQSSVSFMKRSFDSSASSAAQCSSGGQAGEKPAGVIALLAMISALDCVECVCYSAPPLPSSLSQRFNSRARPQGSRAFKTI